MSQAQSAFTLAEQERRPDWMVQGGYMLTPGEAGAWTARVGMTWPTAPWATATVGRLDCGGRANVAMPLPPRLRPPSRVCA